MIAVLWSAVFYQTTLLIVLFMKKWKPKCVKYFVAIISVSMANGIKCEWCSHLKESAIIFLSRAFFYFILPCGIFKAPPGRKGENPHYGIVLISGLESNHMNEKGTIFDCLFNMEEVDTITKPPTKNLNM